MATRPGTASCPEIAAFSMNLLHAVLTAFATDAVPGGTATGADATFDPLEHHEQPRALGVGVWLLFPEMQTAFLDIAAMHGLRHRHRSLTQEAEEEEGEEEENAVEAVADDALATHLQQWTRGQGQGDWLWPAGTWTPAAVNQRTQSVSVSTSPSRSAPEPSTSKSSWMSKTSWLKSASSWLSGSQQQKLPAAASKPQPQTRPASVVRGVRTRGAVFLPQAACLQFADVVACIQPMTAFVRAMTSVKTGDAAASGNGGPPAREQDDARGDELSGQLFAALGITTDETADVSTTAKETINSPDTFSDEMPTLVKSSMWHLGASALLAPRVLFRCVPRAGGLLC